MIASGASGVAKTAATANVMPIETPAVVTERVTFRAVTRLRPLKSLERASRSMA